jgi:hypothetical protein
MAGWTPDAVSQVKLSMGKGSAALGMSTGGLSTTSKHFMPLKVCVALRTYLINGLDTRHHFVTELTSSLA